MILSLIIYAVYVMIFVRPRRLSSYLINGYRWYLFSKERVLFSYPVLAIISLEFSIYTFFKHNIPNVNPFWCDVALQKVDEMIFLGNDPWRVFQDLIGKPEITFFIDFLYHPVWLFLLFIFFLYHAYGAHPLKIRVRYFLSCIFVWAGLGNVLAIALSSAGPCYFTRVTGQTSPYAELMVYLHSIKVNGVALGSVQLQELLWRIYVDKNIAPGSGISAMPSIHVATAILFALSMRHIDSLLEKLLYLYAVVIWVGSIGLGWHYASDGLVSFLSVIVIWYYTGKMVNKIISEERVGH